MAGRIRRLGDDYLGTMRYLRLVAEGKLSPAQIISNTTPLEGDERRRLEWRTRHSIAQGAAFENEAAHAPAIIFDGRDALP